MISFSPSRTKKTLMTVTLVAVAGLSSAFAQTPLKVTTIPEEAATEQVRKFGPLVKYLERTLGMKVEFTPVNDYPAAVEALVNKQVDLVWFGGFTFVQAQHPLRRQDHPDRAARGRHPVPLGVHHADRLRASSSCRTSRASRSASARSPAPRAT